MSGSTIGGVIGGVIGFWVGGPAGAQFGFAIGSAIGGYVDPEKVQGPRLTDAAAQTSRDGIPITWGYGRFPTFGNLIWVQPGPPTEHKKEERQGKGGPEVTTYTYTRSYCIGICRAKLREDGLFDPITGILVVKKSGKIVYDARTDEELLALGMTYSEIVDSRASSSAFLATIRFNLGGESQLPDPTIEAWEGVGNTPAHRGLVNMVAIDHDVTRGAGAIEPFEFVVSMDGVVEVEEGGTPCDEEQQYVGGPTFPTEQVITLGDCIGEVELTYATGPVPDKFEVWFDGNLVLDTGYHGDPIYQTALDIALAAEGAPSATIIPYPGGFADAHEQWASVTGREHATWVKETATTTATVKVWGPMSSTAWYFLLGCPVATDLPPGYTVIPDAPNYAVAPDGSVVLIDCTNATEVINNTEPLILATIVADLFRKAGLPDDQFDVSELTDIVIGYRIASEGGIDSFLSPLMIGFFFDVADWDGVVHCVKRGGDSVLTLTMDDLADRSDSAIQWERIQEAELLRKVTIGYIDPLANYSATAQEYERRISTIQAKGESAIGIPVVTDATTAAQIAEKRTNVAWAERDKALFSLPVKFTRLTATDVVTIIDEDNVAHRVRLMQKEEEPGLLMFEAPKDRQSAYTGSVAGRQPLPPTPPVSSLIGPTVLMVMNLPVLTEAHDEVGLYVAGRGVFPGWYGAALGLSTDAGASFADVGSITVPSTIGYTTTDLGEWDSSEYPSVVSVDAWLPDAPSSVDYETLLRYSNRAAIQLDSGDWAVLQYQTVVANGSNSFTLSGIIHGRYNTTPGPAAAGANFVLLDSSVQFIRAERWMIGETLTARAVSYGTDPDEAGMQTFVFSPCVSQTEWPPHYLQAERDVSDNVTTSCILRGRLGTETAPYNSKYFAGVRFTYSDGAYAFSYDVSAATIGSSTTAEHEYTAAQQTTDFGSPPSSLDITVAGLNSITGAGPDSTGIIV